MGEVSKWTDPSIGVKKTKREVKHAWRQTEKEASRFGSKVSDEWDRFSDNPYVDPVGYYKGYMKETAEQQEADTQKALDEQKRANAETERLTAEGLDLERQMAEEEAAMNELSRQELEKQKKDREEAQAADDAYEEEQQTKVKSRGRRRIALVNTDQKDENVLGNTTVGRKRVLGN